MPKAFNSLSPRTKSFKSLGTHAINVLARLAAKRAVQDELRAAGVRVTLVRPAEISERASVYLSQHPELYQQALERAKQMGLIPKMLALD